MVADSFAIGLYNAPACDEGVSSAKTLHDKEKKASKALQKPIIIIEILYGMQFLWALIYFTNLWFSPRSANKVPAKKGSCKNLFQWQNYI